MPAQPIIDVKQLLGVMDSDSSNETIGAAMHKLAYNIRVRFGRAENIPGNVRVNNGNLPTGGTNKCIGAFWDAVRRRIIYFNYNTTGVNGIYQYSMQTRICTRIFQVGVHDGGNGDILGFNPNYPIHSAAIVYRSAGEGDLLYWTDGLNRPQYLNLDTVSTLAPFTANMLNAAKNAPLNVPAIGSFGSDTNFLFNYVRDRLFRFAYRFIYVNNEKSSVSPISICTFPAVFDPNLVTEVTTQNYVNVSITMPDYSIREIKSVEVLVQQAEGSNNVWGAFKTFQVFGKTEYNLQQAAVFSFRFYNNGNYTDAGITPDDLLFYWLPDKATTLEIIKDCICYGGTTEGYPSMTRQQSNVTIASSLVASAATENVRAAFLYGCAQRFGIQYVDDRNQPIGGVVSFLADSSVDSQNYNVTTPQYATTVSGGTLSNIPKITATIRHQPPAGAVAFYWVRANLTPKFWHFVTCDYQTDNDYLYFGIENFVQMAARNSFVSGYSFAVGDRVKVMASVTAQYTSTAYSPQYDYAILGVVTRTMTGGAQGQFLKVLKPATFIASSAMLIQIYRPVSPASDENTVFYEFSKKYNIYTAVAPGNPRYHRGGTQDQTATLPAIFEWTDGDVYLKSRKYFPTAPIENSSFIYLYMMDANFNDYVPSAANSNAKGWLIDANSQTVFNGVQFRWGGAYQPDTNINELNRFRGVDFATADLAKGNILRMMAEERLLYIYQYAGVCSTGIYSKYTTNNSNERELILTDAIITKENLYYLEGGYGLGTQPTSLVRGKNSRHYFVNPSTGDQCRRSGDGIESLSDLYRGKYTLSPRLLPYNNPYVRAGDNATARIFGCYDTGEDQWMLFTEAGSFGANNIPAYAWSFFEGNEERKGFTSEYNITGHEWAICAEDTVFTFKNGEIWRHDDTTNYCNFFGTAFPASIKLVFNKDVNIKKNFKNLQYQANQLWVCPNIGDVETSIINPDSNLRQVSSFIEQDVDVTDNVRYVSLLRDQSEGPLNIENGDFLNGNFAVINLTYRGNQFAFLFLPSLVSSINQRNI